MIRRRSSFVLNMVVPKRLLSFGWTVLALLVVSASSSAGSGPAAQPREKGKRRVVAWRDPGEAEKASRVPEAAGRAPEAAGRANATTALGVVFLGIDLGGRQYHYNQRVTNATLRPYDLPEGPLLPVAPGVAASAEIYPLARTDLGVGRDIGVVLDLRYDFVTTRIGDASASTRWFSWAAGLRARFHTGRRGSSPVIGVEAGMGGLLFDFEDTGVLGPIMPSVNYRYLRLGADVGVPLGPAELLAGVGYRGLLTMAGASGEKVPAAGALGEHFPHADIRGIDAKIGATLPITSFIEARIIVYYVRFWATFHADVGAAYVAGGALDQFVNADIGVQAHF
jgi:hypothetical protein